MGAHTGRERFLEERGFEFDRLRNIRHKLIMRLKSLRLAEFGTRTHGIEYGRELALSRLDQILEF